MQATRAGCDPPRAPTRRPKRKQGNTQDPLTRDGEDHRTRTPVTTVTPTRATTPKAHRPTGSTRRSTKREENNVPQARELLRASSPQPRENAPSRPPHTRHSTTATIWGPRARQSTTPRAPWIGTPMPTPTRYQLLGGSRSASAPRRSSDHSTA